MAELPDYVQQAIKVRDAEILSTDLASSHASTRAPELLPAHKPTGVQDELPDYVQSAIKERATATSSLPEKLGERKNKFLEMLDRNLEGESIAGGIFKAPKVAGLAASQVVGAGSDIAGEGIKNIVSAVTPEPVKKAVKQAGRSILDTDTGKLGLEAIEAVQGAYKKFSDAYPDAAMALEGVLNLTAFGVGGKAATKGTKEVFDISGDVFRVGGKVFPPSEAAIKQRTYDIVKTGLSKGARPGIKGKMTSAQRTDYFSKASKGVEAIVDNKAALKLTDDVGKVTERLPETIEEFSNAIHSTKDIVFRKYDALAKETVGAVIDPSSIARQVRVFAQNKTIRTFAPEVIEYAEDRLSRLFAGGKLTASEAQQHIKFLNTKLKNFYQNPSSKEFAEITVDAMIANSLRKKLDVAIKAQTGGEYQELKKIYGALKTIEDDVNRRVMVDLRKNTKGLLDFSDVFTGQQAVNAISSKNWSLLAGAATAKGIQKWYKYLNEPDRHIKKMFKELDALKQSAGPFDPKSKLFKAGKLSWKEMEEAARKLNTAKQIDPNDPFAGMARPIIPPGKPKGSDPIYRKNNRPSKPTKPTNKNKDVRP